MPVKLGNGGNGLEDYNPNDGKYVEDGVPNKSYDNPIEEKKILNVMGLNESDFTNLKEYDDGNTYHKEDKAKIMRKKSQEKLYDSQISEYRYKEWISNSNNDFKPFIFNDLVYNNKKEAALNLWYNDYKLHSGNLDITFNDFLNTPIKLYRATNLEEENDFTNPFFSFTPIKKEAESFLHESMGWYKDRSGQLKEIFVKPIDTLGMLPSQEREVIIPNPNYIKLKKRSEKMFNLAQENGVNLPYDKSKLFNLYLARKDEDGFKKMDNLIYNYINKNKRGV